MTTTIAVPPTPDAPRCPPGASPDLWASIVESQRPEALSGIATVFAANACPWSRTYVNVEGLHGDMGELHPTAYDFQRLADAIACLSLIVEGMPS